MMVMTIIIPSTIHNFFKSGINFLKIRSDTKPITAIRIQKPTIQIVIFTCPACCGSCLTNNNTAATRQVAEVRFKGVNFSFNGMFCITIF